MESDDTTAAAAELFPLEIMAQLRANAEETLAAQRAGKDEPDHYPVVKIFNPYGGGTWILTELDADGIAFGLCDLAMGSPELGYFALEEIEGLRIKLGRHALPLERDLHFKALDTLSQYTERAREAGEIV